MTNGYIIKCNHGMTKELHNFLMRIQFKICDQHFLKQNKNKQVKREFSKSKNIEWECLRSDEHLVLKGLEFKLPKRAK